MTLAFTFVFAETSSTRSPSPIELVLKHATTLTITAAFEMLAGTFLPQVLATDISEISGNRTKARSSFSVGYILNRDRLASIAADFRDSVSAAWSTLPAGSAEWLASEELFCVTVVGVDRSSAELLDSSLVPFQQYRGACAVDPGNPIHRRLCIDLIPVCYVLGLRVNLLEPLLSARDWEKNMPGLIFDSTLSIERIDSDATYSARGLQSLRLLKSLGLNSLQNRLVDSLYREVDASPIRGDGAARVPVDSRTVPLVPEKKLAGYVLNLEHPDGKHKANLFRLLLGITRDDWLFLAEQLVEGVSSADPQRARLTEHGAVFHCDVPVTGRNGMCKPVRTAWIVDSAGTGRFRLVTAYIAPEGDGVSRTETQLPILPGELSGSLRWKALFELGRNEGELASEDQVVSPMWLSGNIEIADGICGDCILRFGDGRHAFARWLRRSKSAPLYRSRGGVYMIFSHPTQSMARALAYGEAFARVLRLDGIPCSTESLID